MGVKDTLLTGLFGEGGYTKATFKMNDYVAYNQTLESARTIRTARFQRFAYATAGLYLAVHMFCQYYGLVWDPYHGIGEVVAGLTWLIVCIINVGICESRLLLNRKKRQEARELAEFIDDFVENPANADILQEPERSRLKSVAIDFEMYSQDPTRYDKPWWRLRDPLRRQLDN